MRKALSVLLALSMLLSLCVVPSFAEEAIDEPVFVEEASADDEITQEEVAEDEVELMDGEAGDELEDEVTEPEVTEPYVYNSSEYIESAVEGSKNGSHSASNLYDADNYGTIWHSATGNAGTSEEALANKTVTFTFKKEMTIGGVRIYARKDLGGTPSAIIVTGIYADGSEAMLYSGPTGEFEKVFSEEDNRYWAKEGAHADVYFSPVVTDGDINKVSGLKFTVVEVYDGNHDTGKTEFAAFAGLQFLMPGEDEDYTGPAFEAGEIPVVHSFPSYPAFTVETWRSDNGSLGVEYSKNPNVVLTDFNYNSDNAASSYHANTALAKDADKNVTATFNLAMKSDIPLTFSGIRVYLRTTTKADGTYQSWSNGNANQPTKEGYIYFSADNGATWEKADLVVPAKPTGDDFAQDMYVSRNGVPYDIKGNSIRLEVTNGDTAWSASEVRFLAARGNALIDAGAFEEIKADEEFVALKETIEGFASFESYEENAETIAEAREAYDELSDTEKYVMQYEFENNYLEALLDAEAMIVVEKINALSSLDQVPGNVAVINKVRGIYDNLDDDVKAVVIEKGGLAALEAIEAKKSTFIFEAGDFSVPDGASITFANTAGDTGSTGNLVDEKLTTHNEISISPSFANGGNAWVIINLGKEVTFSGVRAYSRRDPNNTSVSWTTSFFQSITMGNIFVSEDGYNWIEADTVGSDHDNFEHSFDLPAIFGGVTYNIKAQYIKVKTDNCAGGNHWAISELRLLRPVGEDEAVTPSEIPAVTGDRTLSIDITKKEDTNTAEVTLSEGATVTDITANKVALKEGEDYTLSEGTITFNASYINALPVGTNIIYVKLATGGIYKVTLNIADESQVLYCYADVNGPGTSDVVLKNVDGIEEGNITVTVRTSEEDAGVNVSATVTAESITITRINFRKSGSYYDLLGIEEDAKKVLYVDVPNGEGTTTYKVVIYADWQEITSNGAAANFEDDEIPVVSGWKVRADSTRNNSSKIITAFTNGAKGTTLGGQIWHSWHDSVGDPDVVPGNGTRYFDIDLGEDAPQVGGLRYYPTSSGSDWGTVVIEGWDGYEWIEVYNSGQNVANLVVDGKVDMIFSSNTTYRYYRASLSKITHARAYKIRLLYPVDRVLGEYTFETGFENLEEDLVVTYETYPEGKDITKVELVKGTDEPIEVNYTSETYGEVVISKDDIADLAVGTYTLKVYIDETPLETTLEITDNSKGEFKFVYVGTTANLSVTDSITLNNVLGETVNKITLESDETVVIPFTHNEETITIGRSDFRKAFDSYKYLGIEEGEVKVKVIFTSGESLVYTIKLSGDWLEKADLSQEVAFADFSTPNGLDITNEVIDITKYNGFKVRTDSSQSATDTRKWHVANAFFKQPTKGNAHGQNHHFATDEGNYHYIDVDFGEVVSVGGLLYVARKNGTTGAYMIDWGNVMIQGATEFGDWKTLYQGSGENQYEDAENTVKYGSKYYFTKNADVRFVRIYFNDSSYHTSDAIRILKPGAGIESTTNFALSKMDGGDVKEIVADRQIVFRNLNGLEVSKVTLKDNESVVIPHDASDPTKTIILRNDRATGTEEKDEHGNQVGYVDLANLVDLYDGMSLDGKKDITFTVHYDNGTTEDFTVTFESDWFGKDRVYNGVNAVFKADEIDLTAFENFKARTDSTYDWLPTNDEEQANSGKYHPISAFFKEGEGSTFYRSRFEEKLMGNYIDVDFGKATEIAGFRYKVSEEPSAGQGSALFSKEYYWTKVIISGSNDGTSWTEIKTMTYDQAGSQDILFDEPVTYQYIRLHVYSNKRYTTMEYFRFLKPVEEEKVTIKVESAGGTPDTTVDSKVGTATEEGVTGDKLFNKDEKITLTANPGDGATFKYWLEANTGKIITTDEELIMSGSVGRQVLAVFKVAEERFISFYGKDKKTIIGHDTSTSFGEQPDAEVIPSELRAYVSGHKLVGWRLNDAGEILVAGSLGITGEDYYAVYEQISIGTYTLILGEGASIVSQGIDATAIPYGQTVQVKAADTTEAGTFMYWKQNDEIVSYDKIYGFRMPANNITLTPVYGNDAVTEEVAITMVVNGEEAVNADGTKMAGFMITRTVPEGTEVIDTGIIYVRDSAYGDLTTASVGKSAANGKIVNVSISENKGSGQYKFNARYEVTTGIKAIAFITYKVGDELITVYSEPQSVAKTN